MHSRDDARRVVEQRRRLPLVDDEAARDELGLADQRAGVPADGDHGDDDAVAGEVPPVAQHFVADLADARDVDEHAAGRRLVGDARAVPIELDDVAVLREQHLHLRLDATHARACATRACCASCRYSPWIGTK